MNTPLPIRSIVPASCCYRRSIRLKGYDYSQEGAYFVTVDAWRHEPIFGNVVDATVNLNELGKIVDECWHSMPQHYQNVELDEFIVMPDHVHGIIFIVGARHAVPLHNIDSAPPNNSVPPYNHVPQHEQFGKPTHGSLPTIICGFKSAVSKRVNELRNSPGDPLWQRNYLPREVHHEKVLLCLRCSIGSRQKFLHRIHNKPPGEIRRTQFGKGYFNEGAKAVRVNLLGRLSEPARCNQERKVSQDGLGKTIRQIAVKELPHGVKEHIIRNENELNRIRQYIVDNPAKWIKHDEQRL